MAEQLWGVWVTSSCDRDSDDGWMHGGDRPWRGTEEDARAWAAELSRMVDRQRFGHEARPVPTEYGVWCVQEGAWCPYGAKPFRGTEAAAVAEVVHWRSGVRADVAPGAFTYEVRVV